MIHKFRPIRLKMNSISIRNEKFKLVHCLNVNDDTKLEPDYSLKLKEIAVFSRSLGFAPLAYFLKVFVK
jgi:hypothetical protein